MVVVRDRAGWYFINRRTPWRARYPGRFGIGAGGKVNDTETAEAAAERELREETGLDVRPRPVLAFFYVDGAVRHTVHLFDIVIDRVPIPNCAAEWSASCWVPPRVVDRLHRAGLLSPDTAALWDRYQDVQPAQCLS
nr:NUDIX domain-containing protein [Actinoplanes rectilineatus]